MCLKMQIVPYREHIVLPSERKILEVIPVDCKNYMEKTNTLRGQNALFSVKLGGTFTNHLKHGSPARLYYAARDNSCKVCIYATKIRQSFRL